MRDCPPIRASISLREEDHHWIAPFSDSVTEKQCAQDWRDQHRKSQGTEQSEGHGQGHGPEQAAFHPLQREDWHVCRNNDGDGVEYASLHLVTGLTDHHRNWLHSHGSALWRSAAFSVQCRPVRPMTNVSYNVFELLDRTVHPH